MTSEEWNASTNEHSRVRKNKIRTYQYKIDLRGPFGRWYSATERTGSLVQGTKTALVNELRKHPVFKGHSCLEALKRASNEDQLEAALDLVWRQAEARNLLLIV